MVAMCARASRSASASDNTAAAGTIGIGSVRNRSSKNNIDTPSRPAPCPPVEYQPEHHRDEVKDEVGAVRALFGLALEGAHGFKLAAYLDDNLRHSILRLAHAHGVILALVVLAFASSLPPGDEGGAARAARLTGPVAAGWRAVDPARLRPGRHRAPRGRSRFSGRARAGGRAAAGRGPGSPRLVELA